MAAKQAGAVGVADIELDEAVFAIGNLELNVLRSRFLQPTADTNLGRAMFHLVALSSLR